MLLLRPLSGQILGPRPSLRKVYKVPPRNDLTSEMIMAKCPETIDKSTIPTVNKGGYLHQKEPKGLRRKYGGKWFKEEVRIKAACVYAVTGNASRTSEITGVPSGTIRQWKLQPWWPQVIERIRSEHDDELDVKFTGIIDKTVEQINDRLESGDYIYDVKNGEFKRKPMGGKEIAVVTSIMMDKRNMLREKKQIRREETAVMDRLKKLAQEFEGFVKAKDVTAESSYEQDVTKESLDASEGNTIQEADTELSTDEGQEVTADAISEVLDNAKDIREIS